MSTMHFITELVASAPPHVVAGTSYEPNSNVVIPEEFASKIRDVLGIAKWILGPAGVLGLIIFGITMTISQRRNDGDVEMGRFSKVILGVLIGSASVGIIGFFTT